MTYLVDDKCIKCKYTDCVNVCPVDCFYEGENFLAINPDECIDCGVCEPECPAGAIRADTDFEETELAYWMKVNTDMSAKWPNITASKDPLPDADNFNPEKGYAGPDKRDELSEEPGEGD